MSTPPGRSGASIGATAGGTLSTAGNLVFQRLSDGRLLAYTADTGEKLREAQPGNSILVAPSTWQLHGRQYVSVLVDWGGATGLYVPSPTQQYKAPGRLFIFVIHGGALLAPMRGIPKNPLTVINFTASPEEGEHGAVQPALLDLPRRGRVSGGAMADLRYALPATYDWLDAIVRGGAYEQLGMPELCFLKEKDAAALKSCLLSRRKELTDVRHARPPNHTAPVQECADDLAAS